MRKFNVAVIQLDTQNNKPENLAILAKFIEEAAQRGAAMVSLPEVMNLIGPNVGEGGGSEPIPGPTTDLLCQLAKQHKIFIHGGSIAEVIPDEPRYYNTTVMIDDQGAIIATYRKIHTFDVVLPDGTEIQECERVHPGKDIVTVDTKYGKLGFSICYDIRFPELYRALTLKGAELIFTPANFTMPTGMAHWDSILRARAIENGCYIIAAAQIGKKEKFIAYGNSLIIDPWGTVIAQANDEPGVTLAEIDLDYLDKVRARLPQLKNRRTDVYDVVIK